MSFWHEKRKRDYRDLDLDFVLGAHVARPATMAFVCERCVYGSGEHRADCPHLRSAGPPVSIANMRSVHFDWDTRKDFDDEENDHTAR